MTKKESVSSIGVLLVSLGLFIVLMNTVTGIVRNLGAEPETASYLSCLLMVALFIFTNPVILPDGTRLDSFKERLKSVALAMVLFGIPITAIFLTGKILGEK